MYPALFGALTNAVLDPIFIFALDMGLPVAAWATVAARFVTMGLARQPAFRTQLLFNHICPCRRRSG